MSSDDEFLDRLNEALDRRQSPEDDPWLVQRAREDAECRDLLEGHRALVEGLRQMAHDCLGRELRPASDLPQRVLAQLRAESNQLSHPESAPRTRPLPATRELPTPTILRFPGARTFAWLAVAAAVLLAVGPIVWRLSFDPQVGNVAVVPAPEMPDNELKTNSPETLAHTPEPVKVLPENPSVQLDSTPAIPVLVQQAGARYRELADETRESFAEVALLLPAPRPSSAESPHPAENGNKRWIKQVGDGFKPVTSSVGGAFDFLWKSLPVEEAGPTS